MIWFTSDLHFGHPNILTLGHGRPFDSQDQMESYLIDAINDRVSCADELWVLGDFYMRATYEKVRPYLERIVCPNVHFVRGNHDRKYQQPKRSGLFKTVTDYHELMIVSEPCGRAVLSHYPMLDWNWMYHGSYMLHGHIHSLADRGAQKYLGPLFATHEHGRVGYNEWNRANGIRRFDVGVDANGYAPVSWVDIVDFFAGMELGCLRYEEEG